MINFLSKLIASRPIDTQIIDFIQWKSTFTAEVIECKHSIEKFIEITGITDIVEVQEEQVNLYLQRMRAEGTTYTTMTGMKNIRSFLGYSYKRGHRCINPKLIKIKEKGEILVLKNVGESARIASTNMKKPLGRPANVEYIEKVKILKDQGKLTFRQIARAVNKDVSQVYVWYRYPTEKLSERKVYLVNKLSTGKPLASSLRK